METIALSTFRENLKASLQKVADNHAPLVITRQRGEDMVVLSLADFNAMQESAYLLSSDANSGHLLRSQQQFAQGFSKEVVMNELEQ